jgi:hypothetical protein
MHLVLVKIEIEIKIMTLFLVTIYLDAAYFSKMDDFSSTLASSLAISHLLPDNH